jgi:ribosomal protein L11 methyltransferase
LEHNNLKKKYFSLTIHVPSDILEVFYGFISQLPILGIEEKNSEIIITFDENDWTPEILSFINNLSNDLNPEIKIISEEFIQERNWNEEWEKDIEPVIISENIGISTEVKLNQLSQKIKIAINPKMSFGTGHHESTRLACRLMENNIKPSTFWIDAGTGTGVLAILAAKLGAEKVLAFDNNEWSIENAFENVYLNKVENIVEVKELDLNDFTLPVCDGISANLNFELNMKYMIDFYNSLKIRDGSLIISGILSENKNELLENAYNIGFHLIESIIENEWIAFLFSA